jgi:DNA-binding MarR family transcriptional regulator
MEAPSYAEELADTLSALKRSLRRRLRAGSSGTRPSGAEIELLRLVESRPGIGISEAAKELHLAGNSVSTLVNQLVRDGQLIRRTDLADRRAARLSLTEAAGARLTNWRERRAALVRRQVERLEAADQEALRAAIPALRRLAENLREETDRP